MLHQWPVIRLSFAKEKGKHRDHEEIDVQELEIGEVRVDRVQNQHRGELDQGVSGHVLENSE